MYFDSLSALLSMDGHGAFVWSAYAVGAFVVAALVVGPMRRRKNLERQIRGEIRRRDAHGG